MTALNASVKGVTVAVLGGTGAIRTYPPQLVENAGSTASEHLFPCGAWNTSNNQESEPLPLHPPFDRRHISSDCQSELSDLSDYFCFFRRKVRISFEGIRKGNVEGNADVGEC